MNEKKLVPIGKDFKCSLTTAATIGVCKRNRCAIGYTGKYSAAALRKGERK